MCNTTPPDTEARNVSGGTLEKPDKDKEWVDFYYFWKLQYVVRSLLVGRYKIASRYRETLNDICTSIKCDDVKPLLDYLENSPDASLSFNRVPTPHCNKSHPSCINCIHLKEMIQFRKKIKKFNNMNKLLSSYKYMPHQLILDSTQFLYDCSLLKIQDTSEVSLLACYLYDTPVTKRYSDSGFKIIGMQDLSLERNNKLSGKIIVEIDLSYPTIILNKHISTLKSKKYFTIPNYSTLASDCSFEKLGYKKEKKLIRKNSRVCCASGAFGSRAIGLWLYDVIATSRYESFNSAHHALEDGSWMDYLRDSSKTEHPEPLRIFGKARADIRSIRRLWDTTKACVEEGEVLQFI